MHVELHRMRLSNDRSIFILLAAKSGGIDYGEN